MEEKLYFKPEGREKNKKNKPKEKNNHRTIKAFIIIFFLIIIVVIIVWLLRGKATTTGQYPENVHNESLSCVSTTKVYEKANQMISDNRELKINAVFYNQDKLSSIGLRYTQIFDNNSEAYGADAVLRAQFGRDLQNSGYAHSHFNNKFTLMDNTLIITLHAEANEIDTFTREYFLIMSDNLPTTLQNYRLNYESQGFKCESTLDNK